jgi:Domain of unknown function (DUF4399)
MRNIVFSLALVLFVATPALAADTGRPAIVSPKNGAIVSSPVDVVIDLKGAAAPMSGPSGMSNSSGMSGMSGMAHEHAGGHAHLIIDSPLPKAGTMVPVDDRHIHLMGVTKTSVSLPPGKHTLQLIMGGMDHKVPANAPTSAKVTITVK